MKIGGFLGWAMWLVAASFPVFAQYTVQADKDTILAGEEEVKIVVSPGQTGLGLFCVARKGGGNFSDFKSGLKGDELVLEATVTTPFPGEIVIDVLDAKFNKLGTSVVYAASPTIEILDQECYDRIDFASKSMPMIVRVTDHRGQPIRNVQLECRLSEIVNKKSVPTNAVVTPFVWKDGRYEATISNLKDASYRVEVVDTAHLEIFDKADNPDNPYPAAVIEGMNVSFQ